MTRQSRVAILFMATIAISLGFVLNDQVRKDSAAFANYQLIQVGMSVDDVQSILGPGTVIPQEEVPGFVVAVNPLDEVAAQEKVRQPGATPPTGRNYPTRIQPTVEGDHILKWVDTRTGAQILVAFKDGKMHEKYYYDPNYL